MATIARFVLVLTAVLVSSAVFTPCCHAQVPFTTGSWEGVETYTDTEYVDNLPTSETTQTVWATLSIQIIPSFGDSMYGDSAVLSMIDTNISGQVSLSPYGADNNGLSGYIEENIYHYDYGFVYFDAIAASYADATFTGEYGGVDGTFSMVNAYFQSASVPEPGALAEAALAIVSLSGFWCVRRLFARWSFVSAATETKLV